MAKAEIREWPPAEKKEAPQAAPPKERPPDPEKLFVGKLVTVHFMDGTSLTGTLTLMHQYTFVLEYKGKSLLIYKHGVKRIEGVS